MIEIALDDAELRGALDRLVGALADPAPAMADIADLLFESTDQRFDTGLSPAGTPWAPRSPATLAAYAAARPVKRPGPKPLTVSRGLRESLFPFSGPDHAGVASSALYSAVHQFGAARGAFGSDRRARPIPWGDIPARPFLGVSEQDRQDILDAVAEWLSGAAGG